MPPWFPWLQACKGDAGAAARLRRDPDGPEWVSAASTYGQFEKWLNDQSAKGS